ncbi:vancomycin resistance protein VanJ [Arthrobacter stackebrandtii]|uniref:Vancomycin resistance protein VanJ n=1 Tax=Arthrobacter stackebrandtii TaxID=272161 RepID=A0ABS4YYQ4_9MICC|nr:endonuclease/exonuclease/phosphatase family protein [Arthrobacter stackebrandtii]MBP2413869.1 vancomycin resistance protein VanJ [Arthrobacter stackebrandtii]PYH00441.1 endonuclease [Arthrobacter stackebrandtii]
MTLLHERHAATAAPRPRTRAGLFVVACSLGLALLLLAHSWLPDIAGLGLIIDSGLIWLGALIPLLAGAALAVRQKRAAAAVLVPAVVWSLLFVPGMIPLEWTAPAASGHSVTVASQNLRAQAGTAAESAGALAASGAQVVALQEIDGASRNSVGAVLDPAYQYSYRIGTVGLWSIYPISNAQPQDLGLGWNRALSADLETPAGLVRIYVVHAASARPSQHAERDTMLAALAEIVAADTSERIIAVGDFNAATTDRNFAPLTQLLSEPDIDGGLAGFTWPVSPFPVARLDHLLQRGMAATSNEVFQAGASDHLAIRTTLNL